jgi:hypothetical protein
MKKVTVETPQAWVEPSISEQLLEERSAFSELGMGTAKKLEPHHQESGVEYLILLSNHFAG